MIKRQTSLSRNIVQFCRFLRQKGFALGTQEAATALNALKLIDYTSRNNFALMLKSVCCSTRAQQNEFDDLFLEYWTKLNTAVDSKTKTAGQPLLKPGTIDASFKSLKSWLKGNREEAIEDTAAYSIHENLSQKDFALVTPGELDELVRSIKALSKRLAAQLHRRYTKSYAFDLPDLRSTLRRNMRYGGELLEITYKKPRRNRIKLVILCDVSKSMNLYAAFLLQFLYAFQQVYRRMETFAFSTSLQCITGHLKEQDFKAALEMLGKQNTGWGGGTRIGDSLHQFVISYAPRLLDKKSIVIILSDGWDTGDIALLEQSMEIIHTRSKKLVWLNPLAGYNKYQPGAAGMQAAMPFIDVFAPVHNAESLRRLYHWL